MQVYFRTETERRQNRAARSTASSSQKRVASDSFQSLLNNVLPPEKESNYSLNQLWQQLPSAEKELLADPNDKNLAKYRQIVVNIARQTLAKNIRSKKMHRRDQKGRKVELTVIEVIDERLQQMATLMHSLHNSAFNLFKKLEEIRGLLLDQRQ